MSAATIPGASEQAISSHGGDDVEPHISTDAEQTLPKEALFDGPSAQDADAKEQFILKGRNAALWAVANDDMAETARLSAEEEEGILFAKRSRTSGGESGGLSEEALARIKREMGA